jgi:NADH-quinone oxidoreductase subunit L
MMLVTVSIISLLVHIYSKEYLHGDVRFTHYYAFLSLFTASMLFYVLGMSTMQMLVGWELVGVCSFVLIGHWWEEKKNSDAALKAFLTNRVGDVGLLIGITITFFAAGATSFNVLHINEYALSDGANQTLLLVGALALFGGVTSKSGQFPLHTWLPDAMAGPTPVSALIHAATMVVAGVYLVARLYPVFFNGFSIAAGGVNLMVLIGGITIIIGALLAFVQDDIKKVLAYSTISQLAYMVAALGMWEAGYPAAMFHLFTHAFFKALLFLGAGSVIHAAHSNNMSDMGGLKKYMKVTYVTFMIGSLALAGVPPLAGFFSKDEIILAAKESHTYWLAVVLVVGAIITAFYTTRMVLKTFFGEYRGHEHPHESPRTMTVPLVLLAITTCFVGLLGFAPAGAPFLDWVYFGAEPHEAIFSPAVALLSIVAVAIGLFFGWRMYRTYREVDPVTKLGGLYDLLEHKYYLDDLYFNGIVRPVRDTWSAGVMAINRGIDVVVNGAATVSRACAVGIMWFDRHVIDFIVNGAGGAMETFGKGLRTIQTGKVQWYAVGLFAGVVALAVFFIR